MYKRIMSSALLVLICPSMICTTEKKEPSSNAIAQQYLTFIEVQRKVWQGRTGLEQKEAMEEFADKEFSSIPEEVQKEVTGAMLTTTLGKYNRSNILYANHRDFLDKQEAFWQYIAGSSSIEPKALKAVMGAILTGCDRVPKGLKQIVYNDLERRFGPKKQRRAKNR